MASDWNDQYRAIVNLLKQPHPTDEEWKLEASVKSLVESAGFFVESQKTFTKRDRIDLFVPTIGLGIECKIAGSYTRVASQLLRYADHEEVKALLLVTSQASHRTVDQVTNDRGIPIWVLCTAIYSL